MDFIVKNASLIAILADLATIAAIIVTVLVYHKDNKRQKRESTIVFVKTLDVDCRRMDELFSSILASDAGDFSAMKQQVMFHGIQKKLIRDIADEKSMDEKILKKLEDFHFNITNNLVFPEIDQYLTSIEQFSVAANFRVIDLNVVDRLSGRFFLDLFHKLTPFIFQARRAKRYNRYLCDFELMCARLIRLRNESARIGVE